MKRNFFGSLFFLLIGTWSAGAQPEILRNSRGVPLENEALGYLRPLVKSMNEVYYHPQARLSNSDLESCQISRGDVHRQVDGVFLGTNLNVANYVSHSLILIRDSSISAPKHQRWNYFVARGATHLNSSYGQVSTRLLSATLTDPTMAESITEVLKDQILEISTSELLKASSIVQAYMLSLQAQGFKRSSAATSIPLDFLLDAQRCFRKQEGALWSWRLLKDNQEFVVLVLLRQSGSDLEVTLLNPYLVFSKLIENTRMVYVNSLGNSQRRRK